MYDVPEPRSYIEPPDNEPQKVVKCYFCRDWIYEGEEYYALDDFVCCENCMNIHYKQVAGRVEY